MLLDALVFLFYRTPPPSYLTFPLQPQRAHKPQGIEIAREISRACMLLDALVFLFYRSPLTPLPERRRNTLLRYYAFAPGDQRRYVLL